MTKKNIWMGVCIVVGIVVVGLFVPKANWGTVGILLLCPAMHFFMMKDHGGHKHV
ncbi:MAG: hypothetical protein ACD_40C00018G0013 [uncultured bacterium]|nr:MAG: hypothetical protein ACD_40C00018G0013 [uncultured bacterium]KKU14554.1 MAG: hypothetical protein UX21_C0015G0003 [Microgenomates group bacterium GW2011_GWC2_45_8]KKU25823.1 MAG: hypothetical protein UX37_C0011G0009 [Microgenomates group bacterium GW2011_GWA2_46_16]